MTVSYGGLVPNGSTFGCFWKVLGIWRGSVYKLVWRELVAYLCVYYSINLLYRYGLTEPQQRIFERIRMYFGQQSETIPMSFVLGFYVSLVVKRWWEQYKLLPWPDTLALFLNAGIPGAGERQRLMRRNIVRYAVLAYVVTLMRVSLRVKKRFPTWQHLVDSGIMMDSEKKIFELMDQKTPMSKYWMPLVWAANLINRARKENLTTSDHIVQTILTELSDIRRRLGALIGYDTVSVPLVYTQVVSLALYVYFIAALLGRQFVPHAQSDMKGKLEEPDMYFPFFTALQFCFYIGWLKVAEVLINPFGEDDDDIELNWLIDRHMKAAYIIVDEMHEEHPELLKDQYWDDVVPKELPYTVASEHYRKEEPKGSAENYKVKPVDGLYANLLPHTHFKKSLVDDMYADYESVDTPIVERRKSQNWFSRQLSRTGMGSVRSASTAYSSGGIFSRPRGNSVYANPENGQLHITHQKISIYDRLVGRRSGRNQKFKTSAAAMHIKNRPRIPTPDVTKEVLERENQNRNFTGISNMGVPDSSTGVTLLPQQLPSYTGYNSNDLPVVQVVLSPIQEDGSSSVNNTLHPHSPGTAALAQAVLSPTLGPLLNTPVSVPMTVSQLTQLGLNSARNSPLFVRAFDRQPVNKNSMFETQMTPISLTELKDHEIGENSGGSSVDSESNVSHTTASLSSKKSIDNLDGATDSKPSTRLSTVDETDRDKGSTITPSASAPTSLSSMGGSDVSKIRKVSTVSQTTSGGAKRGEVYV
ncbi:bestrophin homolog 24 isoform X2 [Anthonomus grandis grandis]|uniref:bestrophin homolog 24 isoform X2 n=1 Tax=Anthonomus grandis grandis TaxID=2921223 RepID=UPI002165FA88|nr:bestrophin homolog 24 isoform X2 [Anthonomus grandis grandis]